MMSVTSSSHFGTAFMVIAIVGSLLLPTPLHLMLQVCETKWAAQRSLRRELAIEALVRSLIVIASSVEKVLGTRQ